MSNTVDNKEEKQVLPIDQANQVVNADEVSADDLSDVNGGTSGGWSIGINLTIPF